MDPEDRIIISRGRRKQRPYGKPILYCKNLSLIAMGFALPFADFSEVGRSLWLSRKHRIADAPLYSGVPVLV